MSGRAVILSSSDEIGCSAKVAKRCETYAHLVPSAVWCWQPAEKKSVLESCSIMYTHYPAKVVGAGCAPSGAACHVTIDIDQTILWRQYTIGGCSALLLIGMLAWGVFVYMRIASRRRLQL